MKEIYLKRNVVEYNLINLSIAQVKFGINKLWDMKHIAQET